MPVCHPRRNVGPIISGPQPCLERLEPRLHLGGMDSWTGLPPCSPAESAPDVPGYAEVVRAPAEQAASLNLAPTIGSLTGDPDPVVWPENLTLVARDVSDPDGLVVLVEFWLDADGDFLFDPAWDELLGIDSDPADGWNWSGSTDGWYAEEYAAFAQAQDDLGAWSDPATFWGIVLGDDPWEDQSVLANPNWEIYLSDCGYSDLLLDRTPGFVGREYLSGEWGAAVAYTLPGSVEMGPTWLEPDFVYPDWQTNSDFAVISPIAITGTSADGLPIAQSIIANGDLEITLTYEMLDTVVGTPMGFAPASDGGAGLSFNSNRYVLRQTYAIENTSGQPITDLRLFQLLHGVASEMGVYDSRSYPGPLDEYRYDVTLRGADVYWTDYGSGDPYGDSDSVGLDDLITFQSRLAPSAWEIGSYGVEGIDDHFIGKPSTGVHLSIEQDALNGVDSFDPPQLWVAGGQRWDLGSLAPGASTSFDVLLSILTGTAVEMTGPAEGIANGGAATVGGLDFLFGDVTVPGTVFGRYSAADAREIADRVAAGDFDPLFFALPGQVVQLWDVDFSGEFERGIQLTFRYDPELLPPGFDAAKLGVFHFDAGQWVPLPSEVDAADNTVTVLADHLSYFALGAVVGEGQYIGSIPAGDAVVHVYDFDEVQDVTLDSVRVKGAKGRNIGSISIVGPAGGLGLVIVGADSVKSITDARKGTPGSLDDIAAIASEASIGSVTINSGATGYNFNGLTLNGLAFDADMDGDGDTEDLTAFYSPGTIGKLEVSGGPAGDTIAAEAGPITVVGGDLADVRCQGSIGNIAVTGGDIVGSIVAAAGRIGNITVTGVESFWPDPGDPRLGFGEVAGGSIRSAEIRAGAVGGKSIGNITMTGGGLGGDGEVVVRGDGDIGKIIVKSLRYKESVQEEEVLDRWGDPRVDRNGDPIMRRVTNYAFQGGGIAADLSTPGRLGDVTACGGDLAGTIHAGMGMGAITAQSILLHQKGSFAGIPCSDDPGDIVESNLTATLEAEPGAAAVAIKAIVALGGSILGQVAVTGKVGAITTKGYAIAELELGAADLISAELYGGEFASPTFQATSLGNVSLGVGHFSAAVELVESAGNIRLIGGSFTGSLTAGGEVGNIALQGLASDIVDEEHRLSSFEGSVTASTIGNVSIKAGNMTGTLEARDKIGDISVKAVAVNARLIRGRDPDTGERWEEVVDGELHGDVFDVNIFLGGEPAPGFNDSATVGTITGIGIDVALHGRMPAAMQNRLKVVSKEMTYIETYEPDPETERWQPVRPTVGGDVNTDDIEWVDGG